MADENNNSPIMEFDDIGDAVRGHRPLHKARKYRVDVADETLKTTKIKLDDPIPLGRQIPEAVGAHPVEEHGLVAVLGNGDFEDISLDEPFDLRGRGTEKVIYFMTDRSFKFKIDHRDLEWGKSLISGFVLKKLASLPAGYDLYMEVPGGKGHDELIEDCAVINLGERGVERFITVMAETTEGLEPLPPKDREYLETEGFSYEFQTHCGQAGVIIKDFPLPENAYDSDTADLLILLPRGYPDARPDMFFVDPWLKLKKTGTEARCANVRHAFGNRTWQRWSRHSTAWRPGVDGLHTMVTRARCALEKGHA